MMNLKRLLTFSRVIVGLLAIMPLLLLGCSEKTPNAKKEDLPPIENGAVFAAIKPDAANAAGIEIAVSGPAVIRETLTLYGTVKPNAEREQSMRARYPGIVKSVAKRPGDAVKQGETLLTVESNESLRVYAITSPIDGTVLERRVNPGEAVDGETILMRVADLSAVWVDFAVFSRDLGHVRAGAPVKIAGTDGEFQVETRIAYIAPTGEADSQSVLARAEVDNPDHQWVPGQFITGDVIVEEVQAPVAVVPKALQMLDGKTVVFLQNAKGFEAREVEVGRRSTQAVEIKKGLKSGERYAATNSYLVKADLTKGEAEED